MTFFLLTMKSSLRKQDPLFLLPIFIIVVFFSSFFFFPTPTPVLHGFRKILKVERKRDENLGWLKNNRCSSLSFHSLSLSFFLLFLHSFSVSLFYGSSSYSHLSLSEISGIIPPDPSFLTQPVPAPNSSLSFILFPAFSFILFPAFSFVWIFSLTFFFQVAIRVELIIVSYHTERRTGLIFVCSFLPKNYHDLMSLSVCSVL